MITTHCTSCHEEFDAATDEPIWLFSDDDSDPRFIGFGMCALCNTDSRPDYEWDLFHEYFTGCHNDKCVALDDAHPTFGN